MSVQPEPYQAKHPIRAVTATSLFDGHDVAINIMRRILQDTGVEVVHLGHNRSAKAVVHAAIQEDAQAILVSSYQGGHVEYFKYICQLLKENNAEHIQVFGGGGGVIVPREIAEIQSFGVNKIFSPEDGRRLGLQGIINHVVEHSDFVPDFSRAPKKTDDYNQLARAITAIEYAQTEEHELPDWVAKQITKGEQDKTPVLGFTGTGGAGKSSLVDELLLRFCQDFPDKSVAVLCVDPSRKKTGGALLGDRIRMNSIAHGNIYMRSLATRGYASEISAALADSIKCAKAADFDLVLVETAGIGQADSAVVPLVDKTLYVMTAEYGAPTQLEKIEMLDFADIVAINKYERKGSEDALRYVRKQVQRNSKRFQESPEAMPVFGTIASRFNDDGVTALYLSLLDQLNEINGQQFVSQRERPTGNTSSKADAFIPGTRLRYLSEIAETVRAHHMEAEQQSHIAQQVWQLEAGVELLPDDNSKAVLNEAKQSLLEQQSQTAKDLLEEYNVIQTNYSGDEYVYTVRDKEFHVPLYYESLSGTHIPRIALPKYENPGDQLRWMYKENVAGHYPYTAGVFPFKRDDEDPTRLFAGEGDAKRTNQRFKYLSENSPAKRLSTAFDSVTLYGADPAEELDIYGKVGTSGVSICSLDDMRQLYDGFDLAAPNTSVSMTINGPAPVILAFFFNAAIDQQVEKFKAENKREPSEEEWQTIKAHTLSSVRGTVQADILKEDQGQNTCIFSTEFALKLMGDVQEYFIENNIRNFYSVSISGYHIAEAGANPISQLAFTLANGFTFVEYYLSRGMDIDDFARNLSFFFSLSMDPEYAVINRVARRIWAVAMKNIYKANSRSQKLKTHIQTSGRSLHAQEMHFNDIRTTLEALTAIYDNCNSLHTNAYDEAVTTPTEESVRRAQAIQLIINREHGLAKNENSLQGSFAIEALTDMVEEAVLQEFERLTDRGGVLGAMETGYQRSKIQEESMYYEHRKMSGEYPIVGVNTYLDPNIDHEAQADSIELRRGTDEEKQSQLNRSLAYKEQHKQEAETALQELKQVAISGGNVFAAIMDAARVCTLGQISRALYSVGGEYRRNM